MAESLKSPGNYIEAIFQLCRQLLHKDLTQCLEKMAEDRAAAIPSYPYKSFSETLYFVVTSMLRELLQSSAGKCPHLINLRHLKIRTEHDFFCKFILTLFCISKKDVLVYKIRRVWLKN